MEHRIKKLAVAVIVATVGVSVFASSHREAPSITKSPKVDNTDFYMFNSYESGRSDYVTILANYQPFQDAFAGPNYYALDPNALYEIHLDNNGDAKEDITFQFRFQQELKDIQLPIGPADKKVSVSIPLSNAGQISNDANSKQNTAETYTVTMVKGDRRTGTRTTLGTFKKPFDNVGKKSIPDYPAYASTFVQNLTIPGCGTGRVFVGQRQESFAVNLGQTFDLINIAAPATEFNANAESAEKNSLANKSITTLALEVPKSCLTRSASEPIVGGWATASLRQGALRNSVPGSDIKSATKEGGAWTQVSRLGMPLVNEVVIGLKDKDKFNASKPSGDGQFVTYVTNPTLPALIEVLFGDKGAKAPTNFPRSDLIYTFLMGIPGVNKPANVVASEQLRLNTSFAAVPAASQNRLGVVGGDNAGFPNGRRPGDDVVDIELRVAMGLLCTVAGVNTSVGCQASDAPAGTIHFTDGALQTASQFGSSFPYLNNPIPGSP